MRSNERGRAAFLRQAARFFGADWGEFSDPRHGDEQEVLPARLGARGATDQMQGVGQGSGMTIQAADDAS